MRKGYGLSWLRPIDEVPKSSLEVNVLGDGFVTENGERVLPTSYKYDYEVGTEIELDGLCK